MYTSRISSWHRCSLMVSLMPRPRQTGLTILLSPRTAQMTSKTRQFHSKTSHLITLMATLGTRSVRDQVRSSTKSMTQPRAAASARLLVTLRSHISQHTASQRHLLRTRKWTKSSARLYLALIKTPIQIRMRRSDSARTTWNGWMRREICVKRE